jgi:phosphoribosyl 1,2-cyclic phosphate phosphodiesterase
MKVHFLGTGASPCMPHPFCNCSACDHARAKGGRNCRRRSSLLINDDFLIDMGPDIATASYDQKVSLLGVKWCLQTHPHADHYDPEFIISRHPEWGYIPSATLTLIGSKETLQIMDATYETRCTYGSFFRPSVQNEMHLATVEIAPFEELSVGNYSITGFPAKHAPGQGALMYCVANGKSAILYATDTSQIDKAVWSYLGSNNIALDAAVFDHTYGPGRNGTDHLSADDIAAYAAMLRSERLLKPNGLVYGTHFSHEGMLEQEDLERLASGKGYHIAYDGLEILL